MEAPRHIILKRHTKLGLILTFVWTVMTTHYKHWALGIFFHGQWNLMQVANILFSKNKWPSKGCGLQWMLKGYGTAFLSVKRIWSIQWSVHPKERSYCTSTVKRTMYLESHRDIPQSFRRHPCWGSSFHDTDYSLCCRFHHRYQSHHRN